MKSDQFTNGPDREDSSLGHGTNNKEVPVYGFVNTGSLDPDSTADGHRIF